MYVSTSGSKNCELPVIHVYLGNGEYHSMTKLNTLNDNERQFIEHNIIYNYPLQDSGTMSRQWHTKQKLDDLVTK